MTALFREGWNQWDSIMADDGFPACESGWLHPSCDRPSIKKAHLIAPGVPARPGISGKQLDVGAIYKSLYPISDIIRFAAVFSTGINNQLADAWPRHPALAASHRRQGDRISAKPFDAVQIYNQGEDRFGSKRTPFSMFVGLLWPVHGALHALGGNGPDSD